MGVWGGGLGQGGRGYDWRPGEVLGQQHVLLLLRVGHGGLRVLCAAAREKLLWGSGC